MTFVPPFQYADGDILTAEQLMTSFSYVASLAQENNVTTLGGSTTNAKSICTIYSWYVNSSPTTVTASGHYGLNSGTWGGGSDNTGIGTQLKPFQSIQTLIDYLASTYDFGNHIINIYLAPAGSNFPYSSYLAYGGIHPNFYLWGDEITPSNCQIIAVNAACCHHQYDHIAFLIGVYVSGTGVSTNIFQSGGYGVVSQFGSAVNIRNIELGPCAVSQLQANYAGGIWLSPQPAGSQMGYGYTISGGALFHIEVSTGGTVSIVNCTITVSSVACYSNCFISCDSSGVVACYQALWNSSAWAYSNIPVVNPSNIISPTRWYCNGRISTGACGLTNLTGAPASLASGFGANGTIFGNTSTGGLIT